MITIEKPSPRAKKTRDAYVCRQCDGSGRIPQPGTVNYFVCTCVAIKHAIRQLGPLWIGLFPPSLKSQLVDERAEYLKTNLIFHGSWREIAHNAGLALSMQLVEIFPTKWALKITTDEELRAANFSDSDKFEGGARIKPEDLWGPSVELLVLRLGFLGTKNAAMPGFIYTALRARELAKKPTWIIADDDGPPFAKGHFAWSEQLADYLGENFSVIRASEDPEVAHADGR